MKLNPLLLSHSGSGAHDQPNSEVEEAKKQVLIYPDNIEKLSNELKEHPEVIKAAVEGAGNLPAIRFQGDKGDDIRHIARKLQKKPIEVCKIIQVNPADHDIQANE